MNTFDAITLEPMSAGDIIDRAVRLYRRNFLVLVRVVMAPSLVAYTGSILYYIGLRNFSLTRGDSRLVFTVLLIFVGSLLLALGKMAFYLVLGGASRSLVYHFFDGAPLRARDVYRTVRERIWALIGAMLIVGLMAIGLTIMIYFVVVVLLLIYAALGAVIGPILPDWIRTVSNITFGIFLIVVAIVGALLLYCRVVYVPQILMVEGKGVYSSISRSFALASGEIIRIAALIIFWFYVAWSLWLLLMLPLGWYGYWVGVDINPLSSNEPLWYRIAQQTMTQVSEILIAPIAMLGFTLLYLDSKVRKEGFDVELISNRVLPPPPHAPPLMDLVDWQSPPQPVVASGIPSILGLNDNGPVQFNPSVQGLPSSEPIIHHPAPPEQTADLNYREGAIEVIPADTLQVELSAAEQKTDTLVAPSPVVQEVAMTVKLENARRRCRWCGSDAEVEDRFCRVCGSVF